MMTRPDEWTVTILKALGALQKRLYWIELGIGLLVLAVIAPIVAKLLGLELWWG